MSSTFQLTLIFQTPIAHQTKWIATGLHIRTAANLFVLVSGLVFLVLCLALEELEGPDQAFLQRCGRPQTLSQIVLEKHSFLCVRNWKIILNVGYMHILPTWLIFAASSALCFVMSATSWSLLRVRQLVNCSQAISN